MKKTKNGLYINDTWETFLAQRDRLPSWKVPLSIAAVLHLVVFVGAAVLPDVGKKFEPDNVITIDLLSLSLAAPAPGTGPQVAPRRKKQAAAPQQADQPRKTVEVPAPNVTEVTEVAGPAPALPVVVPRSVSKTVPKKIAQKPESLPEPVAQEKPVVQAQPVSLQPLKRKKKLAEDIRLAEVKERKKREKQQAQKKLQQDRERLAATEKKRLADQRKREKVAKQERKLADRKKRQQKAEKKKRLVSQQRKKREISEAARLARQAEQAAKQAYREATEARQEYASVARAVSDLNAPLVSGDSSFSSDRYSEPSRRRNSGYGDSRGERVNPAALNQYAASLNGRISGHWQLPETVKRKPQLRTMVSLLVRRDGSIKDMRIEQKSGDNFFDQSVIKALRNAAPFPYFPALIKQSSLEFVLNFTPQGLAL